MADVQDRIERKKTRKNIQKESRGDKDNGSKSRKKDKKKKKKDEDETDQQQQSDEGYDNRKTPVSKENKRQHGRGHDDDPAETWKHSESSTPKESISFEDMIKEEGEGDEGEGEASTQTATGTRALAQDSFQDFRRQEDEEDSSRRKDRSEKPQVWIRVRPSSKIQDNIFDVTEDGKGVRLTPGGGGGSSDPYNYRRTYREQREEQGYVFTCDGVLRNTSQEETYQLIAHDLVDKAMDGVSGLIVCVGPEISGKHFTLFGSMSKFQYRGIIPRCLERIFQICELKASDMRYLIRMAIVEIRHDKIRDLLTLGSYDGNSFDKDSTHGMVFQKIGAAEHGFGLLIRALTCQKEIPREPYAKPHTVVFIDIYGESYTDGGQPSQPPRIVKSRITFAKTAPIPERDEIFPIVPCPDGPPCFDVYGCCMQPNNNKSSSNRLAKDNNNSTCSSMACAKRKTGVVAETIRIRQDISYLEQMCSRACQYRKITKYYEKYSGGGGALDDMMLPQPPPSSQHFRLSKLTYCLKDIVSGNAEIRIVVHIRPEKRYKHATLEAMRFADKAKCVPYGMGPFTVPASTANNRNNLHNNINAHQMQKALNFGKEMSMFDFLSKMPTTQVSDLYVQVSPGTFKTMQEHGFALFDGKIHGVTEVGEPQMHELFEKFRIIWNHVMETGVIPTTTTTNTQNNNNNPPPPQKSESRDSLDRRRISTSGSAATMNSKKPKSAKSKANLNNKSDSNNKKNKGLPPQKSQTVVAADTDHETRVRESEPVTTVESVPEMMTTTTPADKNDRAITPADKNNATIEAALDLVDGGSHDARALLESREAPTKQEAWTSFLSTEGGSNIFSDLAHKNKILQDLAGENNTWIKEASQVLASLNRAQTDLNLFQQDRFMQGDTYDEAGNIIVPSVEKQLKQETRKLESRRDELVTKLKDIRSQLFRQKNLVEMGKLDVENAFQTFSLSNYATTYTATLGLDSMAELAKGTAEGPSSRNFERMMLLDKDEDEERIRKFEDIKRVAKKQARFFLRALARKPSWVSY